MRIDPSRGAPRKPHRAVAETQKFRDYMREHPPKVMSPIPGEVPDTSQVIPQPPPQAPPSAIAVPANVVIPQAQPAVPQPPAAPVVPPTPEAAPPAPPAAPPLPDNYREILDGVLADDKTPAPPAAPSAQSLQAQAEAEDLRRQLAESRQRIEELEKAPKVTDELLQLQREREADAMLDAILTEDEWAGMAPQDAKRMLAPVLKLVNKRDFEISEEMNKKIQEAQAKVDATVNGFREEQALSRLETTKKRILKVHPQLEKLRGTQKYAEVMMQPVAGYANKRYYELVEEAYKDGDSDYIIKVLDYIVGQGPSLDDVASVSPVATGTTPAVGEDDDMDGLMTPMELATLRADKRAKRITHEEYSAKYNKHREAAKKRSLP